MSAAAIGIDIGGTFTKVVVLDDDGAVVHRERMPTDDGAASRLPDDVGDVIATRRVRRSAQRMPSASRARAWSGGRATRCTGCAAASTCSRASTGPARWAGRAPVRVINDAQAALAGECAIGAGRGCRDVVLLTIGTGVGGAIMCDGRVLSGNVGRAGHLGHIALQVPGDKDIVNTPGSLEDAIGNCTIAARTGGRFTSTAALLDGAPAGRRARHAGLGPERDAARRRPRVDRQRCRSGADHPRRRHCHARRRRAARAAATLDG